MPLNTVNGVEKGQILGYDHITLWVGNAKQAASYYCVHLGFKPYAYRGLETGERDVVSHVVCQNDITIEFQSALKPDNNQMGNHLVRHGDGVKDIAFTVNNIEEVVNRVKREGGVVVSEIHTETDEKKGFVSLATIQAFGDMTHTFVERSKFNGLYLPGYIKSILNLSILSILPPMNLKSIDHWAGVQSKGAMESVVEWYEKCLKFTRFWSIDENVMHTEFSAFRAVVLTNGDTIKLNISEPAVGKRKAQTQEFLDFYGGPGIHHFAFSTDNIIKDVQAMRERGVEFVKAPAKYYGFLKERLQLSKVVVKEDLDVIQALDILLDFDDTGYLLQIFTKPVEDRPTFVIEIIQRNNFDGFGVGNFKSLYQSMEAEQALRGNA